MTKKWYQSKTLMANVVLILGIIAQIFTNTQIMDPEIQAVIVSVVNIILRFMTKGPIK